MTDRQALRLLLKEFKSNRTGGFPSFEFNQALIVVKKIANGVVVDESEKAESLRLFLNQYERNRTGGFDPSELSKAAKIVRIMIDTD